MYSCVLSFVFYCGLVVPVSNLLAWRSGLFSFASQFSLLTRRHATNLYWLHLWWIYMCQFFISPISHCPWVCTCYELI